MAQDSGCWLSEQVLCTALQGNSPEEIREELLTLLERSGCVQDRATVRRDIIAREALGSTAIEDGLNVPHALTEGVTSFCMALGIAGGKTIHLLTAWPQHTPRSLKTLGALLETLQSPRYRDALLHAESAAQLHTCLLGALSRFGLAAAE